MKILLIGYGSIGKRHYQILGNINNSVQIDIVTKQKLANITTFQHLTEVNDLINYDLYIISSETAKHYEQLLYISEHVQEKLILVEKPLFDKRHAPIDLLNNHVFVAYNLRFHPIIRYLKDYLKIKKILFANIICGQHLPTWRPDQDYRESYSADIKKGGGVLRDLSHELDYCSWLFGSIETIQAINTKISNLQISSDDIFTCIGITSKKTIVNITLDYISKTPMRKLVIHTDTETLCVDIIDNSIKFYDEDGSSRTQKFNQIDRDYTYLSMHTALMNQEYEILCDYQSALAIVSIFEKVPYKENL